MSEENALALSSDANALSEVQKLVAGSQPLASNDTFDKIAKAHDYLPRIQLCGSSCKLTKLKKIACSNFAYVITNENFKDLGSSVDIYPITWRPKALDMSGDTPVTVFDEKSDIFKEIQAKAGGKDSECTFGPEFLVWIPSIKAFACLHMGSKTARSEAGNIRELLNKGCTLSSKVIEGKNGFVWEAIVASPCTTPFVLPSIEALKDTIEKFNTEAKAKVPVKAVETTTSRTR